ncbi:MAG: hypothetical protein M1818_000956 [Claussenomyces sp. TS43310]|nr:MAG: hypothetical protein M1818_000956 [Claussenomyces sp. TS43310]
MAKADASQSVSALQYGNDTMPMSRLPSTYPSASALDSASLLTGNHRNAQAERIGRLQRSRIFFYLTIMAAIMFTINILQIALMPHIRSKGWILTFPIVVFASMSTALVAYVMKVRETLKESWDRAEVSQRVTWVGILASILLPIVFCEFIYINLVAVPSFNKIVWTSTVDLPETANLPAIIWVALNKETFGPPACNVSLSEHDYGSSCSGNMELDNSFTDGNGTYGLFDPSRSRPQLALNGSGYLTLNFTAYSSKYDKNSAYPPNVIWLLLDPALVSNFTYIYSCGFTEMMDLILAPAVGESLMTIEQSRINDDIGSLDESSDSLGPYANCSRKGFSHYNRWDARLTSVSTINAGKCITGSSAPLDNTCVGNLLVTYSSLSVTTQTSSHSIGWKQMLLDEGSIVGGITFVTWFFGIFVA